MSGLTSKNVLIVGASIAGPTTAYWLAKAGAKVTVIERFQNLRTSGQAVDIRTAGVSVMRKMAGMEAQVRAKSTKEEGVCVVRENGRPYGVIRASGNSDQQSLISEYEIFRGDLANILYGLTEHNPNIKYVFGEQVISMQLNNGNDGPITVEFKNGLTASDYDLVIACDGATSRTRAMGLGCGVRDHIVPINCWAAYFTIEKDLLEGSKLRHGHSAVGGRLISVGSDASGSNTTVLMSIPPKEKREATLQMFREALTKGDNVLKEYIAQHYGGVGWKSDVIVQEMMKAEDFYASEIVQVKVPSLSKGRFVLVGDAGYAAGLTGGGTSLALVGGYMLAGELLKHSHDLAEGVRAYEEQMQPLIKEMQSTPPFIQTFLAPQTAWGIWIRNNLFAFIAWTGLVELAQKYLGGAFASTETVPIPDYDWVA